MKKLKDYETLRFATDMKNIQAITWVVVCVLVLGMSVVHWLGK